MTALSPRPLDPRAGSDRDSEFLWRPLPAVALRRGPNPDPYRGRGSHGQILLAGVAPPVCCRVHVVRSQARRGAERRVLNRSPRNGTA